MFYEFSRMITNKKKLMVLSANGPRYGASIRKTGKFFHQ